MAAPRSYRPSPGEIRSIRACIASGTTSVGSSMSGRPSPCDRACRPTSRTRPLCIREPSRWCAPARASSGPSCAPRSKRCSWSMRGSEFDPRFNVKYRDDKSTPISPSPSGGVSARPSDAWRKAQGHSLFRPLRPRLGDPGDLDLALRVFPMRTCSAGVFRRAGQVGRPCLLGYIDKCSAPCGRIDAHHHRAIAEDFCDFMAGTAPVSSSDWMWRCVRPPRTSTSSGRRPFATTLRHWSGCSRSPRSSCPTAPTLMSSASRTTSWRLPCRSSMCAAVGSGASAAGSPRRTPKRLPRSSGTCSRRSTAPTAMTRSPRGARAHRAREQADPRGLAQRSPWLDSPDPGPQRGDKRRLMETVTRNATQSLARHKVVRAGDLTARSQALQQLQEYLGLEDSPLRIECFDISHVQGPKWSARWWSSGRIAASRSIGVSSSEVRTRPAAPMTRLPCTKCWDGGSTAWQGAGPARPRRGRPASRRALPIHPTSSSSTVAFPGQCGTGGVGRRGRRRHGRRAGETARRGLGPGRTIRWCCRATARVSISSSVSGTKRTGLPSPFIASGAQGHDRERARRHTRPG